MSVTTDIRETSLYRTIHRQPADWRALLERDPGELELAAERLRSARRIFLAGIGTSHHCAEIGAFLFRAAGREAWAVHSPDFASYPFGLSGDDAVIVISHRGAKTYAVQSLQRASEVGAWTLGITGVPTAMTGADQTIQTVEQETSATFTASYTAALLVLARLAGLLGTPGLEPALAALPGQAEQVLVQESQVRDWATEMASSARIIFAGGGIAGWTAREGALKSKEAAYVTAEGITLEALLHGVFTGLNAGDSLITISPRDPFRTRAAEMSRAAEEAGLVVYSVGVELDEIAGSRRLEVPLTLELLSPFVTTLPLQLLSCFLAEARGTNPDRFRLDQEAYARALKPVKF